MDEGIIDVGYLGDWDPVLERSSFLGRARQGPRLLREIDNRINLYSYANRPFWRRIPDTSKVVGLAPDKRQNLLYVNLPFDIVRALTGVMYYQPTVEATPRTIDPEDIARAHAAKEVADHLIEATKLPSQFREVLQMCHMYGHAWMKVCWNPDGGERRPIVRTNPCPTCAQAPGMGPGSGAVFDQSRNEIVACPTCNTQGVLPNPGGPIPAYPGYVNEFTGMRADGEVAIQAVHPDDVYVDPDAGSLDDVEELYHNIRLSPEQAWRQYGKFLGISQEEFEKAPTTSFLTAYDTNAAAALMRPTTQRYINVGEYYRKPDEKHPEGLFAIYLGDNPIFAGKLPYMHDRQAFPFFAFKLYTIQGIMYPMATLDLVLPMIFALNDHLSALNARARISARLRLKMPIESRAEINDRTGHLEYRDRPGRSSPEPMSLAPMPSDAVQIREILEGFIDRISGATDLIRGGAEASEADSARALAFLEERAIGPLKPIIADHAGVLDRVIKYSVDLARLFYDDGRVLRALGASGAFEAREFRVDNVGESTDIKIRTVRDVGRSRATMMAEINEAAQFSMIQPEQYAKLAEFGEIGQLYKERKAEMDMAAFEDQMLSRYGQMPHPNKRQNHDIHNDCHTKALNVITMRNPNDPLIPTLLAHMDEHDYMKAQMAVQAQMMQQQAAAAYGQANAANPAMQPESAQQAAQAASPNTSPQGSEPFQNAPLPPGQQPALGQADSTVDESVAAAQAQQNTTPIPLGAEA